MKTTVWFGLVLGALSAAGEVVIGKVGGTVKLQCGGGTYLKTLMWYRGSEEIHGHRQGFFVRGRGDTAVRSEIRNMRLDISRLTEEDAGEFKCNVDGSDRIGHTLLVISASVTPSGILQVGSEATLQCKLSGPHKDCSVEWIGPDGRSHESVAVLKSVAASDAGNWKCKISRGGIEIHTQEVDITVKVPTPTTTKPTTRSNDAHKPQCTDCHVNKPRDDTVLVLGLKWWVWVAIGVGVVVVIILIVCVIVKCIRIRRKKRRYLKMKQAQQELKTRKYCQCVRPPVAEKPPQQGRRREKPSALPL